jgi:hypothetical protein
MHFFIYIFFLQIVLKVSTEPAPQTCTAVSARGSHGAWRALSVTSTPATVSNVHQASKATPVKVGYESTMSSDALVIQLKNRTTEQQNY